MPGVPYYNPNRISFHCCTSYLQTVHLLPPDPQMTHIMKRQSEIACGAYAASGSTTMRRNYYQLFQICVQRFLKQQKTFIRVQDELHQMFEHSKKCIVCTGSQKKSHYEREIGRFMGRKKRTHNLKKK
jgi:hypothetical protein